MKRVKNVQDFVQYDETTNLVFKSNDESGVISAELEINTVGPCVVRLQLPNAGKKVGNVYLVGVYEGLDKVHFAIAAPEARLVFEPSGEVWFRHNEVPQGIPDTGEETFTRLEKPGLYLDDLSLALHRQSVLQNIAETRRNVNADAYQRRLEKTIDELSAKIDGIEKERAGEQKPPENEGEEK